MIGSENVTLIKQDGRKLEGIEANVQPTKIFIENESLPLEEGDTILRALPNGLEERYLVLDRGFWQGYGYQAKVSKITNIASTKTSSVVYNLHGSNARININSVDSSVNVVNIEVQRFFEDLKAAIEENIEDAETRAQILNKLEELKNSVGTRIFPSKYSEFIATAADYMTLVSPFLPGLTQLLVS